MGSEVNSIFGGVVSYFVRHRTIANLLLILMLVIGLVSVTKIRAQFFPDVILETVIVSAKWKGAGAEDIDNSIVGILEANLIAIESVESIDSFSTEGRARISVNFEPGIDMAKATEDVEDAVADSLDLPENMDSITVKRRKWRDRVTNVVISGAMPIEQLSRFADEFVQKLYKVGVTRTSTSGISSSIIRVSVPEANLVRHDITLRSIADIVRASTIENPAGEVTGSSARIKTGSDERSLEQIDQLIVLSSADGSKVLIGDIAKLELEGLARGNAYFKGDDPALMIRVDRGPEGDAINIQNLVQDVAEDLQRSLPKDVEIELSGKRADAIKNRLNILLKNGAQGLFFVLLLLFLFLSARTAFWVALGIPAAMLFAIGMMYLVGLTLNMISLFALILCLGIVVDDAIVVGEHADFRARRLGENPVQAAERSALRMGLPVFTATITTVLAFGGLVAVGGRFGSLIADIPFTVIVVLLASLAECFLILPNHMRHALAAKIDKVSWYDWPSFKFNNGFRYVREKFFRPATKFSIFMRYPLIAGALALLAISLSLLISGEVKWRFFNSPETGRLTGNIAMLPTATREDTMDMLRELDRATLSVAKAFEDEHGVNPLTFALLQIGGNSGRSISGSETKDPDQLGSISVELIDADLRDYSSYAFVGALQGEVRRHPLLETLSFRNWTSGPGSDSISISLFGSDLVNLKSASESLISELSSFSEISGLEDNQAYDKDELILELKPKGNSLGFSIDKVGNELHHRLNGIEAASFLDGTRTSKIIVGLPKESLGADFIEKTHLRSSDGTYVKLSDIVSVSSKFGFSSISRENGQRLIIVSGDLSEDDPEQASLISEQIREIILPNLEQRFGIATEWGGLAAQEKSFLNDAVIGFSLCLLGIYLTLTWVFESWLRPIVVMAIIPFGIIGTLWGHYLWNVPLSMFSIIGLIGMTGIIINDSIVLITTIDEYSKRKDLISAIIDATSDRLRPVLLTTLTTVLGLLPLLFETSKDAQFLKPTVITLVYGLGFGMFLVLFLVPAIVAIQLDIGRFMRASRRLLFSKRIPILYTWLIWIGILSVGVVYSLGFGSIILFGEPSLVLKDFMPSLSPLTQSALFMIIFSIVIICLSVVFAHYLSKKKYRN